MAQVVDGPEPSPYQLKSSAARSTLPPVDDASNGLQGRLELTWTNKPLRLLAHEDGGYEWVPSSDYRVAEVRLLDDADALGRSRPAEARASDNLLIRGDALNALTSLAELPQFAKELADKVRLAYLDPPFNTQQSWLHYDDALEHSVWLSMMRDRLVQVRKLLAPDGSIWVHCDDSEQAYLKVMMDELFGRSNFIANVVWEKTYTPKSNGRRAVDGPRLHRCLREGRVCLAQRRVELSSPDRGSGRALYKPRRRPQGTVADLSPGCAHRERRAQRAVSVSGDAPIWARRASCAGPALGAAA